MPALIPLSNYLQGCDRKFSFSGSPLLFVLTSAKVKMRDIWQPNRCHFDNYVNFPSLSPLIIQYGTYLVTCPCPVVASCAYSPYLGPSKILIFLLFFLLSCFLWKSWKNKIVWLGKSPCTSMPESYPTHLLRVLLQYHCPISLFLSRILHTYGPIPLLLLLSQVISIFLLRGEWKGGGGFHLWHSIKTDLRTYFIFYFSNNSQHAFSSSRSKLHCI